MRLIDSFKKERLPVKVVWLVVALFGLATFALAFDPGLVSDSCFGRCPEPKIVRLSAGPFDTDFGPDTHFLASTAPRPPSLDEILGTNGEMAAEQHLAEAEAAKRYDATKAVLKQEVAKFKAALDQADSLPETKSFLEAVKAMAAVEAQYAGERGALFHRTEDIAKSLRALADSYVSRVEEANAAWYKLTSVPFDTKSVPGQALDDQIRRGELISRLSLELRYDDRVKILKPVADWQNSLAAYFEISDKFGYPSWGKIKELVDDDQSSPEQRHWERLKAAVVWLDSRADKY